MIQTILKSFSINKIYYQIKRNNKIDIEQPNIDCTFAM